MTLYEQITAEIQRLDKRIAELQKQIKKYPKEDLFCAKSKQYVKWYIRKDNQLSYLPKSKRNLAEKLSIKKYNMLLFDDLIHERQALEQYLKVKDKYPEKAQLLFEEKSSYKSLLSKHFQIPADIMKQWGTEEYESNPYYPENLIHKTIAGHFVRSKSESLIVMSLFLNKIAYRYEAKLEFPEGTYYPDFSIIHPKTGKIIYWEHFGKMDDFLYCSRNLPKLNVFCNNGIVIGDNLIVTFESKEHPLTSETIEQTIQKYLLS